MGLKEGPQTGYDLDFQTTIQKAISTWSLDDCNRKDKKIVEDLIDILLQKHSETIKTKLESSNQGDSADDQFESPRDFAESFLRFYNHKEDILRRKKEFKTEDYSEDEY